MNRAEANRLFMCKQYDIKPELYDLFVSSADNEEARQAFAASFSIPVGERVQPISTVRNIFSVRPIPAGQLAIFPKRFGQIDAWMIPRLGEIPQNVVVGDDVMVSTFKIAGAVEWDIDYARDGRWDIVEGAKQEFADSIVRQEETEGWRLIAAAVTTGNTVTMSGETTLTKRLFNSMITKMKARRYNPSVIYVSPTRAGDIRDWATVTATGNFGSIDPVTQREIFVNGNLGSIFGVNIVELDTLADTDVYLFDTTRLGVMPIRGELVTYDDPVAPRRMRNGIFGWLEEGFCVMDEDAIVKGTISSS